MTRTEKAEPKPLPKFPLTGSVRRADLLHAVRAASSVTEARTSIPILSYVAIEAVGKKSLKITGTDLFLPSCRRRGA